MTVKARSVDTIASNEEHVRLRIYEGAIPVDEADREMRSLEMSQLRAENARLRAREAYLEGLLRKQVA